MLQPLTGAMPKTIAASLSNIENHIFEIRGQRIILDSDLAALYGVSTKQLNQQVKRNTDRFPADFVFQLTNQEVTGLKSQNVTSSLRHGGRRKLPYAFTEYGAIMAANVLNSPISVHASIQVVRAFVRLRHLLISHQELAQKLSHLEQKYDAQFQAVFKAIRQLMEPPMTPKKQIGFT